MPIDPTDYSVKELRSVVHEIEDVSELNALLAAEEAGDNRKTARRLIVSHRNAVAADEDGATEADAEPTATTTAVAESTDTQDSTVSDAGPSSRSSDQQRL